MSTFVKQADIELTTFDWGNVGWRATAKNTGCTSFVVMDVSLEPGMGHDFHKHPQQDEMIIVKEGSVTQFIAEESTTLNAGDSVYIDQDTVHASFNDGDITAQLQVIIGPAIGEDSYELVDVSQEAPWNVVR